ncbi:hypothetical protein ACFE04_021981 [Oxalis oulophora]
MIQELLGGASCKLIGGGERKISINGTTIEPPSLPSSPSPSPSASTTLTNATSTNNTNSSTTTPSTSENLRCPRCDSPNTKFCYYNNYNLTQPRHFCKTCRRYWTKGGALRNVPIGGGCRKNRSPTISSSSSLGKSSSVGIGKLKAVASGFDHQELSSSSFMWGPPQNSHILALLRAANHQNPNPNPNMLSSSNSASGVKEENMNSIGSHHIMNDHHHSVLNGRAISGLDSVSHSQAPFWKQQNGFMVNGDQSNSQNNNSASLQDLYQRLRSTTNNYYNNGDHSLINGLSNVVTPNNSMLLSSSSVNLDTAPAAGGELLGFWNNSAVSSWSDLPTTSGAYP